MLSKLSKKDFLYPVSLLVISLLFLLSVPLKNFPLIDDQLYFRTIENFLQTNEIRINELAIPTFLLQLFYGAIFAKVFGLSYITLRISTVILSVVGIIAFYFILRNWFSQKTSFLSSMLLLVNPIYFYLSHTFMTDIPALTFGLLSILFFIKWDRGGREKFLLLGSIFSILAFLIRQFYILIIPSIILYYIYSRKKEFFTIRKILILLILPGLVTVSWFYWRNFVHGASVIENIVMPKLDGGTLNNFGKGLYYLGLFLFPLGIIGLLNWRGTLQLVKKLKSWEKISITLISLFLVVWILSRFVFLNQLYFMGNILHPYGLGPLSITGEKVPIFPMEVFNLMGLLGTITGMQIVISFFLTKNKSFNLIKILFLIYFATLVISGNGLDRYFLIVLPLAIPLVVNFIKEFKISGKIILVTILIFGIWSFYGTFESMSWNESKWKAVNYLLENGIPPEKIDGGGEYNVLTESCKSKLEKCDYVVSFDLGDGEKVAEFSYTGFFGERLGTVYATKQS